MSDETKHEAREKAENNGATSDFVDFVAEATGVFSDVAGERVTVKIGGNTASYVPRTTKITDRDPVMRWIDETYHDVEIQRIGVASVRKRGGGTEKRPKLTLRFNEGE